VDELEPLLKLDLPHRVTLEVEGMPLHLACNDSQLEQSIKRYYAPFLRTATDGGVEPIRVVGIQGQPKLDESALFDLPRLVGMPKAAFYRRGGLLVVLKKRTGVVYYIREGVHYAVGDLVTYPQQLFNLVASAFASRLRTMGYVALHASAAALHGQGVAFAGPSGSGKSTAGIAILEAGLDFVSNDRIFITRGGSHAVMVGAAKWPRVNPGTLLALPPLRGMLTSEEAKRYGALPPDELWELQDKHDVRVDRMYGERRLALRTRLDSLYVLSWVRQAGEPALHAVDEDYVGYLVAPLLKSELTDPPDLAFASVQSLSALLKGVNVYQVTGAVDIPKLVGHAVKELGAPAPTPRPSQS
jgi:HprK-related kinase B